MTHYFAPVRAGSGEPLELDMQSLFLTGRVVPFGAKLRVRHVFRSSEKSVVEVVYCFPLPRDASLTGFEMAGEGFRVSSRLEPRAQAEKRYEQALEWGSLAAVTQQNRDGMVNLTVGNLRPGETVTVDLDLVAGVSLSDGGCRLRFPFTVAPCYQSQVRAAESVEADIFLPALHKKAEALHRVGFDLRVEPARGVREVASPSHAIRMAFGDGMTVRLSPEGDVPNRDLVLDVQRDLASGQAWGSSRHFGLMVPSTVFGTAAGKARRVVFVLDRSGSMGGVAMRQARAAVESCLAALGPEDQFNVIAFDDVAERFRAGMVAATRDQVDEAVEFVSRIEARGGTELAQAIEEAAQALAGRGEIFVITDGQVFGTVEILRRARKSEARLFCLGIGSASQDRFLELLARQTGGICRFVTPRERMESAAKEVFGAVGGVVAASVEVAGASLEPAVQGPIFTGTPLFAFGDLAAAANEVEVRWAGGSRRIGFEAIDEELAGLLQKLQGARLIADAEAGGEMDAAARQRVLALSERFGLASSEMSLVAVVERAGDRAGELPQTRIVAVGLAEEQVDIGLAAPMMMPIPAPMVAAPSAGMGAGVVPRIGRAKATEKPRGGNAQPDFVSVLRELVRAMEDLAALRARRDANGLVDEWLKKLVAALGEVREEGQKAAIEALIDFVSSDLIDFLETGVYQARRWVEVRRVVEGAWPAVGVR
jgi:Ca-activated chloride channel family protein